LIALITLLMSLVGATVLATAARAADCLSLHQILQHRSGAIGTTD
jgi:hypothetical protein